MDVAVFRVYHPNKDAEPAMLDSFIIDRIRREREQRERDEARRPLQIERPMPPPPQAERPQRPREEDSPRGSVVIDFRV